MSSFPEIAPADDHVDTGQRALRHDEIIHLMPPEPVFGPLCGRGGRAYMSSTPGGGKSALLLDAAITKVTGEPSEVLGPMDPGHVVWVAGEAVQSFGIRYAAALDHRGIDRTDLELWPYAVHFHEWHTVEQLLRQTRPPDVLVLDTLASCLTSLDENVAGDAGLYLDGVRRYQDETGAAVIAACHPAKSGAVIRGSGAFEGDADTITQLKRTSGSGRELVSYKARNSEPFRTIPFEIKGVTTRYRGELVDAPVPTLSTPGDSRAPETIAGVRQAIRVLSAIATESGASTTAWLKAFTESADQSEATFYRRRKDAVSWGFVAEEKRGNGTVNHVTEDGRKWLTGDR